MSQTSFGTEINVAKKRVNFYNRSGSAVTIYEGMPVCYMFDTTTNVLGWSKSSAAKGTTTAEGYQNEGKFLIVELPYSDNLLWFAGVVANGGYCGKTVAATSYKWLDIYEPDGKSIVPVRAGVECTVGKTVLSIISDLQYLGQPLAATQARPVAIAEETNATLDTTNGIILAKLCPDAFIYQELTGDALSCAVAGTSAIVANRINLTSAQTSGTFCAFEIKSASTAGATSSGYGLAFYAEATVSGSVANHIAGSGIWLNITGGTPTENITACQIGLYEDGATMTSTGLRVTPLTLTMQVDDDVTANCLGWMFLEQNGTQQPDDLILGSTLASLPAVAFTGTTAGMVAAYTYGIKVYLANQPGTQQWYIPIVSTIA